MGVEESLSVVSERLKNHSSAILTEEAVKTAIILPFLSALGYDVFNPNEVIPEFTADAVGKKGERVDYAVKVGDKIRILIECKPISMPLDKVHLAQLYRYFSVTSAKFALLTNGRTFNFHTDLEEPNKLDTIPFLSFDLSDLQGQLIVELKRFSRDEFDVDGIRASASRLKYTSALKRKIGQLFDNPTEDLVRLLSTGLYEGRFTAAILEQFAPLVKSAFRDLVRESVQSRLSSALAETIQGDEPAAEALEDEVETTPEEIEGYLIVKAIVRDVLPPSRIFMRDQKSYCGILVDNNNRKPLARLHFNRGTKYVGLFDAEKKETRTRIDTLDQIYDLAPRLREAAAQYAVTKKDVSAEPDVAPADIVEDLGPGPAQGHAGA